MTGRAESESRTVRRRGRSVAPQMPFAWPPRGFATRSKCLRACCAWVYDCVNRKAGTIATMDLTVQEKIGHNQGPKWRTQFFGGSGRTRTCEGTGHP